MDTTNEAPATLHITHPRSPRVREALFDLALINECISGVVFLNTPPMPRSSNFDVNEDDDGASLVTDRLSVLDIVRQSGSIGRVAIIDSEGGIEIFPPLDDQKENDALINSIYTAAEAVTA